MRDIVSPHRFAPRGRLALPTPAAPVLTWQGGSMFSLSAPSATSAGYLVERSLDGSTGWTQIDVISRNQVVYLDRNPHQGSNYYRAREITAYGVSGYSNVVPQAGYPNDPAGKLTGWNGAINLGPALFQHIPAYSAYADNGLTTPAVDGGNVLGLKDLSGNGCHFLEPGAGTKPTYVASGYSGKPAIRFTGTSYLDLVAAARATLGNLGAGGKSHTLVFAFDCAIDGNYHCLMDGPASTKILYAAPGSANRFNAGGSYDGTFLAEGVSLFVTSYNAVTGVETTWHNGQKVYQTTGAVPAAGASDAWRLGLSMGFGFGLVGDLIYDGGFEGALDPTDTTGLASFHQALAAQAVAPDQWHIAFTGNSLVARGWMHDLMQSLGTRIGTTNFGWSGIKWAGMRTNAPGREIRFSNMFPGRILLPVYQWTNDQNGNASNAPVNIAGMDAYMGDLTAAGFGGPNRPRLLIGPLSSGFDPAGNEARAIRTAMLARCGAQVGSVPNLYPALPGETSFEWYYDATNDPTIGAMNDATAPNYLNTTYFNADTVHLSYGPGETYAGNMLAPACAYIMSH